MILKAKNIYIWELGWVKDSLKYKSCPQLLFHNRIFHSACEFDQFSLKTYFLCLKSILEDSNKTNDAFLIEKDLSEQTSEFQKIVPWFLKPECIRYKFSNREWFKRTLHLFRDKKEWMNRHATLKTNKIFQKGVRCYWGTTHEISLLYVIKKYRIHSYISVCNKDCFMHFTNHKPWIEEK